MIAAKTSSVPWYRIRKNCKDRLQSRNDTHGPAFKIRNDPSITAIRSRSEKGFARRTTLVLQRGVRRDVIGMVGPRPLSKRDVSKFDNASLMRRFRRKTRPHLPMAGERAQQHHVFILDQAGPHVTSIPGPFRWISRYSSRRFPRFYAGRVLHEYPGSRNPSSSPRCCAPHMALEEAIPLA